MILSMIQCTSACTIPAGVLIGKYGVVHDAIDHMIDLLLQKWI